MFERNRVDSVEQGMLSVEITLSSGEQVLGKVALPVGRNFMEFLNGPAMFIEFEPYEGEKSFLAKSFLRSVRPLDVQRVHGLSQRLRDLDGFDPWQILGLPRGSTWDEVRSAYHRLAKAYHPDRYATAELPDEVVTYLASMARRVNAAYAALEASLAHKRQYAGARQQPIYTSPART